MIFFNNNFLAFIVLIVAFTIAFGFYYYSKSIIPKWVKLVLFLCRFFGLFLIGFVLLSPILEFNSITELKPSSCILIDNSASILNHGLSKDKLNEKAIFLKEKLISKGFDVDIQVFDSELHTIDSLNLQGKKTNIFNSLQDVIDNSNSDNLKNIILFTDGNYNLGNNPLFVNNHKFTQILPVLIGDTMPVTDLALSNLEYNPIMLSTDLNHVSVLFSAIKALGSIARVRCIEVGSNQLIFEQSINCSKSNFTKNIEFKLPSLSKGNHHLRLLIENLSSEKNTINNQLDFNVKIVDGIKKVEILSNFPHPDISALAASLKSNKSIQVAININPSNLQFSSSSDLLIFYQIPNQIVNSKSLFEKAKLHSKSVLYILGTQSDLNQFNILQQAYSTKSMTDFSQDYSPVYNKNFNKFYFNESTLDFLTNLPPLSNKLFNLDINGDIQSILNARIGKVVTSQSLFSIGYEENRKIGCISAENFWKWRLINFNRNKSFVEVDDFFQKIVDFLIIKNENKQLVTRMSNFSISQNEDFEISASTYNTLFQFEKPSKINCIISKSGGEKIYLPMNLNDNMYSTHPSGLSKGAYSYEVKATILGKDYMESGSFMVMEDEVENHYLPSNYEEMNSLAIKHNGGIVFWNNFIEVLDKIKYDKNSTKLVEKSRKLRPNEIFWILLSILCLFSFEWVVRKYNNLH